MRKKRGIRQARPGGIFSKDAYVEYADMHRELFCVEAEFLTDKSVDNVAAALDSGAVIWASSRDIGEPCSTPMERANRGNTQAGASPTFGGTPVARSI